MGPKTAKKISFKAFINQISVEGAECSLHCPFGDIDPCPREEDVGHQDKPCNCYYFLYYLYEEFVGA